MKKNKGCLLFYILIFFIIIISIEISLRQKYYSEYKLIDERMKEIEIESLYIQSENKELIYESIFPLEMLDYNKKEEVYRIIIIGDSIAKGQGLKDDLNSSFGKLLEQELNSNKNKTEYEVIIFAASGYSTSQEIILLKEKALKYKPNLILWSYVLNDPANPRYHDGNGEFGIYFNKPKIYFIEYINKKIFFFNEKRIFNKKKCEQEYHKLLHCVYWEDIKKNIEEIANISKEENIKTIFLIHPIFENSYNYSNYSLNNLHKQIKEEIKKNNLLVLDILDIYKNYNPYNLRLNSQDPWHPNEIGHEIIKDYIYSFLKENIKGFKEK
jgi:lysophospholipase L1-like esterase